MDEDFKRVLEQCAEEDYWEYRGKNPKISEGEAALEAIHIYESYMLKVPDWVVREISNCWHLYKEGRKGRAFFIDKKTGIPGEPLNICVTLGEAFGVEAKAKKGERGKSVNLSSGGVRTSKKIEVDLRKREVYRAVLSLFETGRFNKTTEGERSAFKYISAQFNVKASAIRDDYYAFKQELEFIENYKKMSEK